MKDLGVAELLAAEGKAQGRERLVEETDPGLAPRDRSLVDEALRLVRELVRTEGANVPEPRPIALQRRGREQLGKAFVLEAIELEREEERARRDISHLLAHVLRLARDGRVRHVGGVAQPGVAREPPERLRDSLVLGDGIRELGTREAGELALIVPREIGRRGRTFREIAGELGRVRRRIEIAQVPFGQAAEAVCLRPFGRRCIAHVVLLARGSHIGRPAAAAKRW